MTGTTTDGLPYPDPTDPVAEGADAIRALAEAITAPKIVTALAQNSMTPTTAYTDFPLGVSLMSINIGGGTGWPTVNSSQLITIVRDNRAMAVQMIFANQSLYTQGYVRTASGAKGWAPWASAAAPYGSASGRVTFPATAGGSSSTVTVTFPTAAFTANPVLTIAPYSPNPSLRAVGITAISPTGFTAVWENTGSAGSSPTLAAGWIAQQDTSVVAQLAASVDDATVTCPTDGCSNEGIPISIATHWTDDEGNQHPVDEVLCGVCGTILTPVALEPGEPT